MAAMADPPATAEICRNNMMAVANVIQGLREDERGAPVASLCLMMARFREYLWGTTLTAEKRIDGLKGMLAAVVDTTTQKEFLLAFLAELTLDHDIFGEYPPTVDMVGGESLIDWKIRLMMFFNRRIRAIRADSP